jgi:NlpC/P60 family putative phage cell wall peptidase
MPSEAQLRAAVVAEARSWIDTPYRHQASLKGVGCDCGGLIRGVGEAAGVLSIDPLVWKRVGNYGRMPNPNRVRETLELFLTEIDAAAAGEGDIVWLAWREELPMHLALLASGPNGPTLIHALADVGPQGRVVEHGFVAEWPGRADSWWRYPGVR